MILTTPNSILTTPAKRVKKVDKKIKKTIEKMKRALTGVDKPKGVGLAAPQIGESLAIFITKPTLDSPIRVFFNPKIIWASEKLSEIKRERNSPNSQNSLNEDKKLEGCLSIPNIWGKLLRPQKVRLRFMDINGVTKEEEFSGFMATIVQHETDHVNGILFTQRVLAQGEKLYRIKKGDKEGEEKLVEIEV